MASSQLTLTTSVAKRSALLLLLGLQVALCGCQFPWRGFRKKDPSLEELIVHPEPWDADARLAAQSGRRTTSAPEGRKLSENSPYANNNGMRKLPFDEPEDEAPQPGENDGFSEADFREAYAAAPAHLRPLLKRQWEATQAASASAKDAKQTELADSSKQPISTADNHLEPSPSDRQATKSSTDKTATPNGDKPVRLTLNDHENEPAAATPQRPEELTPPAEKKTARQVAHSTPIDTGVAEEVSVTAAARKSSEVQTAAAKADAMTSPMTSAVTTASAEATEGSAVAQPAALSREPATLALAKELSWHDHVREAIRQLEKDEKETQSDMAAASPVEQLNRQAVSRMLHLSLGELEPALKPIENLQTSEQEFFRHEFQALHDAIDPNGNPVLARRWTLVMDSQRKAVNHLGSVSNLEIKNAAFCSNVDGFGSVTKFPNTSFRPKQEVLLYCELENFVSLPVKDGFQTVLQGSYEIVDASGHRVFEALLSEDADICRHQRRDYFIAYRIYMPETVEPGRYQLRLTIEDMKGRKFGQSSLDFQIAK